MAGLTTVPVVIKELRNDEAAKIALIENLQREDLNAMDQARALQRLQKEFNLTQDALSESVGKSRTAVTNLLRLLNLSSEVQELLEAGKIEMGHARALLPLEGPAQLITAHEVISKGLSVREVEKLVSKNKNTSKTNTSKLNKNPNTQNLERELSEILGAKIEIKHNSKGKGKMVVNFNNLDALQGILDKIKS